MWRRWAFLTILMVLTLRAGDAFELLTAHEPVRPSEAPGGLLYCLAKGHTVFRVESPTDPRQPAAELSVSPVPIETIGRREMVLIDGAIPVNGESAPDHGRRLYVVSVGWVEHLICIKGAPI
jgi:hypothetical protein